MMPQRLLPLLIATIFITTFSFTQVKKSEQQLTKYLKELKSTNTDTIVILNWGCKGCRMRFSDTSTSVDDGQTIYTTIQKNGLIKMAVFDDVHEPEFSNADTCSLFKIIEQYKLILKTKEPFYKSLLTELKHSKFVPPRPDHYNFQELIIKTGNFRYNFVLVDKNADQFGFILEHEEWFSATKMIVKAVYNCSEVTTE